MSRLVVVAFQDGKAEVNHGSRRNEMKRLLVRVALRVWIPTLNATYRRF
jgi:hypothetical protein